MIKKQLKIVGWREWLSLPEIGVDAIKAKIDTGARTSSLHAFDMRTFRKRGRDYVEFKIHPQQRSSRETIHAVAPIHEFRKVKSSNGQSELRPVILTTIELMDDSWEIELTLANRDEMGFRMLVGREGIRKRMLVDSGKSYISQAHNPKKTVSGKPLKPGLRKKKHI